MSLLSLSGGRKGGGGGGGGGSGTIDEKFIIFSSLVPVLWLCLEVEFSPSTQKRETFYVTTHDILGQGILERLTKGTLSPCPKISWVVTGSRKMSLSLSGEGRGGERRWWYTILK